MLNVNLVKNFKSWLDQYKNNLNWLDIHGDVVIRVVLHKKIMYFRYFYV